MIGSLFHLLQDALACGGFNADPMLSRIIKQDLEITGAVSIATTRVPDFGEQISNPSHGFRSLCCLSTVTSQFQDIPRTFHPSYELLASKTQTDNPVAICFAESFQPMGIDLASHFNIIFYPIQVSSFPSLWGTSTSAESSLSPWDSISAVQSRNTSPQVDVTKIFQSTRNASQPLLPHEIFSSSCDVVTSHVSSPQPQPVSSPQPLLPHDVVLPHTFSPQPQPQELQSRAPPSSPLSLLSPRLQSLPPPLPPQSQSLLSPPPITLHCSISNLTPNESSTLEFQPSEARSESESILTSSSCSTIPLLLRSYVITDEQKVAAKYERSFKGLYLKVRNFYAMNYILDNIGYSLPFRVTADPTTKLSDVTVKASEVLQYFGWAPTSFEHKTLWYGTAKALSQRNWKRSVPGK